MGAATAGKSEPLPKDRDTLGRKVIDALERYLKKDKSLCDPKLRIEKYFDAYKCLLKYQREWTLVEEYVKRERKFVKGKAGKQELTRVLTRSDLKKIAALCSQNEDGWTWPGLFITTCIWGHNEKDKGGPAKLFRAMRTDKSTEIIVEAAKMTQKGLLQDAHKIIDSLDEIGGSYATKFLYAVGTSEPCLSPCPVIFDGVINRRLQEIAGDELLIKNFNFDSADGYVHYCKYVEEWANELGRRNELSLQSADVEFMLFTSPSKWYAEE